VLTGTLAADAGRQRLRIPVRDPAAYAAAAFAAALRADGVSIEAAQVPAAAPEHVIARHTSPPLTAICKPMLGQSNNLYAEQVWRVAACVTGDGGTASAERHAKAVLHALGVDTRGMVLADGSGLSRRNLVQPSQIARVLVAMQASPHREAFTAGLPVAGLTGTLRSRFADGPARGHVRAKTGFVARVVCLSGYVPRPDPAAGPLVFSVMLNDFTCDEGKAKAAADAFVQRLAALAGW
jgi:D-alanyl-D-alanine carboxypeptidase/D-alanyl-D-alanine-endopeptidase (penicillin-binding protein 4)